MSYSHPILTCDEAQAFEKELLRGDSAAWTAMSRAGRSLGQAVLADFAEIGRFPSQASILVLLGKGHNGGDALIAAGEILKHFPKVEVSILPAQPLEDCRTLTRRALDELQRTGRAQIVTQIKALSSAFTLCLDGVLGMNFKPPMREPYGQFIKAINGHERITLRAAVDLPSGLGDGGFRADFTYATGIAKAPLFDPANAAEVGRVRYLDIGFFDASYDGPASVGEDVLLPEVLNPLRGLRPAQSDKRTFGHLFVLSGSRDMPGALLMSVKAALRSGVGLVTVFAPESVAPHFAAAVPEAMWVPFPETPDGGLALEGRHLLQKHAGKATALLTGSGLGREPETLQLVKDCLGTLNLPTVVDADALMPEVIAASAQRAPDAGPVVLTPHAGEFKRLSGRGSADYDSAALKAYCREHSVVTLFKGAISRISDGEQIANATFGGPVLARGGSGDILAGLCGGLLAQRPTDGFSVACMASAWHGLAASHLARRLGPQAVTTTDLLDHLGPVLRDE